MRDNVELNDVSEVLQELSRVSDVVTIAKELESHERLQVALEMLDSLYFKEELFSIVSKLIEAAIKRNAKLEVEILKDMLDNLLK